MARYLKKIRSLLKSNKARIGHIIFLIGVLILIFLAGLASYFIPYSGKIYPNTYVGHVNVSGQSVENAHLNISKGVVVPSDLTLLHQDQTFVLKLSDIEFSYNLEQSAKDAYNFVRTGNILTDTKTRISLLFTKQSLPLKYSLDEEKLTKMIDDISKQLSIEALEPSISVNGNDITVSSGKDGKKVESILLANIIKDYLASNDNSNITIPVKTVNSTLSREQEEYYTARASKYLGKELNVIFEDITFNYKTPEIIQLLDPLSGYRLDKIADLIEDISISVERDPQNSKFSFANGKVVEFQPALEGIIINRDDFQKQIEQTLDELSASESAQINLTIPVDKTSPEISIDQVNDFGIKELIGKGTSTYYHSIPGRIHNITLAASRINGTLLKPGNTFSFNQTLGEVSATTGYQQAYVISEGKTILGDGGGVCQVSTTLFRAVLDAGLPIIERQAHAYRVSYYEQDSPPGLDATVYSPSPDFKFTNDTNNYILIEAVADAKNYSLVFELYGASDGRESSISKPVVTSVTAPPEDLYQDDPTLPAGTVKQIDWKAWGAKVSFNYVVTRNGEKIINKTFVSNYKPWRAVYLRGTGIPSQ